MKTFKKIFLLSIAAWLFASCASAPMTDRKQVRLKSDKSIERQAEAAYRQFLSENALSKDADKITTVKRVTDKLIASAGMYYQSKGMEKEFNHFRWEVNVIENSAANAFCAPGGKMAVFTGLFSVVENEDQLATVMAHEIGHALAKHGNEKSSQGVLASIGAVALDITLAGKGVDADTRQIAQAGYSLGAMAGFLLPFSRTQEKEADKIGLYLMTMAGYDPEEAPRVWQNMIDKQGDSKIAFFQTHPTNRRRRDELQELVPEAIAFATPYRKQPVETQPSAAEPVWVNAGSPASDNTDLQDKSDRSAEEPVGQPLIRSSLPKNPSQEEKHVATPTSQPAKEENPVISAQTIVTERPVHPESNPDVGLAGLSAETVKLQKVYRVQLTVLKDVSGIKAKIRPLEGTGDLIIEPTTVEEKTYQRIFLGEYNDFQEASIALKNAAANGFPDAFIVKYIDGRRVFGSN